MEIVGLLALMGGAGYMVTRNRTPAISRQESSIGQKEKMWNREYNEQGLNVGTFKPTNLGVTNLNDAWKPRSAPRQRATSSLPEIYGGEAESSAYVQEYGPDFYFMTQVPEIPLATAAQSNMNVEIPSCDNSIRGDDDNVLWNYPRVYCDYPAGRNPHIFTGERNTLGAGEPTESEELYVPREGDLNILYNPWGPGGAVQNVMASNAEAVSRRQGVNQSSVLRPARTKSMFLS